MLDLLCGNLQGFEVSDRVLPMLSSLFAFREVQVSDELLQSLDGNIIAIVVEPANGLLLELRSIFHGFYLEVESDQGASIVPQLDARDE